MYVLGARGLAELVSRRGFIVRAEIELPEGSLPYQWEYRKERSVWRNPSVVCVLSYAKNHACLVSLDTTQQGKGQSHSTTPSSDIPGTSRAFASRVCIPPRNVLASLLSIRDACSVNQQAGSDGRKRPMCSLSKELTTTKRACLGK